jgi:hypothetical protein
MAVDGFPSLRLVDSAERRRESGDEARISLDIGQARLETIPRLLGKAGSGNQRAREVIPSVTCAMRRRDTTPIIPGIQARSR